MQTKATVRFHVTPIKKVIIKEQTNTNKPTKKYWPEFGEMENLLHYVNVCIILQQI